MRDLLKCFLVKCYPVGNSAEDLTAVDEIVAVGVDPIFVVVVNLKLEVRWNPRGLDWGKIDAFHHSLRYHVRNVSVVREDFSNARRLSQMKYWIEETYMAQIPVPVPTSRTSWILSIMNIDFWGLILVGL